MAKIRFSKELYPKAAIDQAISDFAADATIAEQDDDYMVDLKTQRLRGEFCNYVLGLTKQSR